MATIKLFFLGLPRFERDGRAVDLTSAKAVTLLAYLALTRTPQPRERLLGLLWAESAEEAARKNLRNTLWAIRKALGEAVIDADGTRLRIAAEVWIDVLIFERVAAQALDETLDPNLDLYRGPLLEGLALTEAPNVELWIAAERERLGALYLQLLGRVVERRRLEGDWRSVIRLARRALAYDNLQEAMHRTLMDAYARTGERTEALRQYELLKTTLKEELGVDPLPETAQTRAAILSGEVSAAAPPTLPIPMSGPRPEKRPALTDAAPHSPFLGRAHVLAALDAELDAVKAGRARIVLIAGEMGMGKSRLWREWAATLPDDQLALEARFLESTQALPFSAIKELFSSRACARALFTPETTLSHVWLTELSRLFPDLKATFPDLPASAPLPPEEERRRVLEAFTQSLLALKADPLIIFADDLHWADRASLDWFDYLIHRLHDQPLLLVGAYRPNEVHTGAFNPLAQHLAAWTREGIAQRLTLERLSERDSRELLEALGSSAIRAGHVQALSAGNPYFLIELSRTTSDVLPASLVDLVTARLGKLPESARQVVQAAAVLEPEVGFTTLVKVSGRSEDETLDALDALLAADVLAEQAGQYGFAHPLVATIVRGGMSRARSAVLNRRAAAAREADYATRLPLIAGRLAAHYEQADDPGKAATYAQMAAQHAMSLAAGAEAEGFLRMATRLDPSPERYIALGRQLYLIGNLGAARTEFTTALTTAERAGDQRLTLDAMLSLAETYVPAGQAGEIEGWVNRAHDLLQVTDDPRLHARALFLLGVSGIANRPLHEAEAHLLEATRLTRENGLIDMAAHSCFELGNLMAERGDLAGAVRTYRESIDLAHQAGDTFQEVLGHNNAAYHAVLLGDLALAREQVERGLGLAEGLGLRIPLQYLYSTRGELALAEGQWAEAEAWFRRGLVESERSGNQRQRANLQANLGLAARGRGDLESAHYLLETARDQAEPLAAPHLQAQIDLWLVEVLLGRGEIPAAIAALLRAEARLAGTDRARLHEWAARLRGELAAVTG
jgi:DNA-binding SARP family transcriptional activator